MIDFRQYTRLPPYAHQVVGVEELIKEIDPARGRIFPRCFGLFDEMGVAKTKQVIDAAQVLAYEGMVDRALVVCPNGVRPVWFESELGELRKHLWDGFGSVITEFRSRPNQWFFEGKTKQSLKWVITNYEYIRDRTVYKQLFNFCGPKTVIILDESSLVKNSQSQQFRACRELRKRCGWSWLLNGTPVPNNPGDLFAQGLLLDPRIIGLPTYTQFKSKYAILGGFENRQIVGWVNLDDLQQRLAPYVIRRLKAECLDLPEKLPPVIFTVPMDASTWKLYREMRDELVAWLSESTISVAQQAITKVMRLAQITSGFLGGLEAPGIEMQQDLSNIKAETIPDWMIFDIEDEDPTPTLSTVARSATAPVQEISREKLDFFLQWMDLTLYKDPTLKLLVWSRFVPEVERTVAALRERYAGMEVAELRGGQKKAERDRTLRLLDPRTAPRDRPAVVVGIKKTGSMGLNLTAAHTVFNLSEDYNLKDDLQSQDRVHRPGQVEAVSYYHLLATGPKGQKTIDHVVFKARQGKRNLADLTSSAWIRALQEE